MEILIRDMSAATVKELDQKEEYASLVKNMAKIIGNNTEQMQKTMQILEDILEHVKEESKNGSRKTY